MQSPFSAERHVYGRNHHFEMHSHAPAQLLFAKTGTMQVSTKAGRWLVPPQLAVWLPPRLVHWNDMLSDVEMWTIFWREDACGEQGLTGLLEREFVFHVTPLIRSLVFRLFEAAGHLEKAATIAKLLLYEVAEAPVALLYLPLPVSAIGKRIADVVFADVQHRLDSGAIADRAATSSRTISRLFPDETGMTFRSWRQRARIISAIDGLSNGQPASVVASRTGFATAAAFTFAFRQVTGVTPNVYREHGRSSAEPAATMPPSAHAQSKTIAMPSISTRKSG